MRRRQELARLSTISGTSQCDLAMERIEPGLIKSLPITSMIQSNPAVVANEQRVLGCLLQIKRQMAPLKTCKETKATASIRATAGQKKIITKEDIRFDN